MSEKDKLNPTDPIEELLDAHAKYYIKETAKFFQENGESPALSKNNPGDLKSKEALSKLIIQARESVEYWRPVPSYERLYEVSTAGRVRSIARATTKGGILKPSLVAGYPRVSLSRQNVITNLHIHRLVAKAFLPNPDNKPCVNHIDGNRTNNSVNNLEWCTYQENELHSFDVLGKINGQTKLTKEQVLTIRDRLDNGERGTDLAKEFGVSTTLISKIKHRISWPKLLTKSKENTDER